MNWSEIKSNLRDLLRDRKVLAVNNTDRKVYGHLYTNQVASSTAFRRQPAGAENASPAKLVAELLGPAADGVFSSLEDMPATWRGVDEGFAKDLQIEAAELLQRFKSIGLEFGRERPTRVELPGDGVERYRRDIRVLRSALFDTAIDEARPVRVSRDELLDRLPADWRTRLELLSVHEIAAPSHYEPIRATVHELTRAIDENVTGYIALVGPPGAGKSTLLSQELRGTTSSRATTHTCATAATSAASAATQPRSCTTLCSRSSAAGFRAAQRLWTWTSRRWHDVSSGTWRSSAPEFYAENGERAIIMVDGLDHVHREVERDKSLLRYLPRPEALPPGVLFVVGSQNITMLDPGIAAGRRIAATCRWPWPRRLTSSSPAPGRQHHRPARASAARRLRPAREAAGCGSGRPAMPGRDAAVRRRRRRPLRTALAQDRGRHRPRGAALRSRPASASRSSIGWLRDRGQPAGGRATAAGDRLAYLFRRQGERWHFFHDSFLRLPSAGERRWPDPADTTDPARKTAVTTASSPAMCKATAEPHLMCREEHSFTLPPPTSIAPYSISSDARLLQGPDARPATARAGSPPTFG